MKENKLTKRLNPIFGDNIAKWEIYDLICYVESGQFWPGTSQVWQQSEHNQRVNFFLLL